MVSTCRPKAPSNLTRIRKRQRESSLFPLPNMFSGAGNVMLPSIPVVLPSASFSSEWGLSTSSAELSTQSSATTSDSVTLPITDMDWSSSSSWTSTESSTTSSSTHSPSVTASPPSTSSTTTTIPTTTCSTTDQLLCILSSVLTTSAPESQTTFSSPEPSTSTSALFSSSTSSLPPPASSSFSSSSSLSRTPTSTPHQTSTVTPTPTLSTRSLLSTSTTTPIPLPTPTTPVFSPTSTPLPTPTTSIPSPSRTTPTAAPSPSRSSTRRPSSSSRTTASILSSSSSSSGLPVTATSTSRTIISSSSTLPASIFTPYPLSSATATDISVASSLSDSSSPFPLSLITSPTDSSTSRTTISTPFIPRTSPPTRTSTVDTSTIIESPLPSLPSSSAIPISTILLTSSLVASSSSPISPASLSTSLPASTTSSQLSLISSDLSAPTATTTSSLSPGTSQGIFTTTMLITSGGSVTTISTIMSSGILNTNVPNDGSNDSFAHNIGAIVGVIMGALIALAFIAIWIYLAIRRRKRAQTSELQSSIEQLNIPPDRGWRSPIDESGDEGDLGPPMSTQYPGSLTQRPAPGEPVYGQGGEGEGEWDNDGVSSAELAAISAHSAISVVPSTHPAFGQATATMRDPTSFRMVMADSAPVTFRHRRSSGGQDPSFFVGTEPGHGGHTPSIASSSRAQSSMAHDREVIHGGSGNANYEEDPFARAPPTHSSSKVASSYFETGSSNGHNRSMDATRQKSPTPPGGNGHKKVASTSSERSFKRMLGRLRSGSLPAPDSVAQDVTSIHTSPSLSRHPTFMHPRSTSPSIYAPPSSLLRPQSPNTVNYNPPTITLEHQWPGRGPSTLPSSFPGSVDSLATPDGLLNPRARMDSTSIFGDHEDGSRPLMPPPHITHEPSTTAYDTDNSMEHREA